jgi:hypothetical protein
VSVKLRQKFGIGLAAAAAVTAMFFLSTDSNPRVVASGQYGKVGWIFVEGDSQINWRHAVPIIVSGAIGISCLVWPPRKPPKLTK